MKKFFAKKGFTLIELMIVVAIVGIMTAATMVSLSSGREAKQVEGEARKFASAIRELQNYALTGKKFHATEPTCQAGLRVIFENNVSTPFPSYKYRSGTDCGTMTIASSGTFALGNGVRFGDGSGLFAFSGLYFTVPRGDMVNAANVAIASTTRVSLKKGSSVWSVCIYPGGRVEEYSGASCP